MSRNNEIIIRAHHLGKTIKGSGGSVVILEDLSLEVKPRETVAITGISGSGKTTLLSVLAGLDTPGSGSVMLDGTLLSELEGDAMAEFRRQKIGFIFQTFRLLPTLSALENVLLPLEIAQERYARDQAADALTAVGLGARLHHYPQQLSGGEQQRVAIARAYVTNPAIIFADEPTANLDRDNAIRVTDLLFSLNKSKNTTLVVVTHDPLIEKRCQTRFLLSERRLHAVSA